MKRHARNVLSLALGATLSAVLFACGETSPQADKSASSAPVAPLATSNESAVAPKPAQVPGKSPTAQLDADKALSGKVKEALQAPTSGAPLVSTGHVQVSASDGVVTLEGTVDAPAEKQRAALLAMNVEGVRSVVNNLIVVRGS